MFQRQLFTSSTASSTAEEDYSRNDGFAVSYGGDIAYTPHTRRLLDSIGGVEGMVNITTRFYLRFHSDRHIRQFLGGLQQPLEVHAARLGKYVAEQMGATSKPWESDTRTRERTPIKLANGKTAFAVDRMSAHHCAWHSVDRPAAKVGRRFKLDDCRVWMRLFFLAVRDAGHDERSPIFKFLRKFIGHFIAIYESTARQFILADSAWGSSSANVERYIAAEHFMDDVVDVPLDAAVRTLTTTPREIQRWLYDDAPVVA